MYTNVCINLFSAPHSQFLMNIRGGGAIDLYAVSCARACKGGGTLSDVLHRPIPSHCPTPSPSTVMENVCRR